MPKRNYSNEDFTYLLKTLSKAVVEALEIGYDYDGVAIYDYLNMRLNRAVAKDNAHNKKLMAELMLELNEATNKVDQESRTINDAVGLDIFMSVVKDVVAKLLDTFEIKQSEIVITNHGSPVHVVKTVFAYAESEWQITIYNQNLSDKHEPQHQLHLDGEHIYELSKEDDLVLSLLTAITTMVAVDEEVVLMTTIAKNNPAIIEKAKEIQAVFGKEVDDHLEVALIFYSLTRMAVVDDKERDMAAYIRSSADFTPQQTLNRDFIEDTFGFSKSQAKIIYKIFSKKRTPLRFGWKPHASKDNIKENPDD